MDTISSRESNTNFLPMVAVAVGAVALILAIVALVKMSSVSKDINEINKGVNAQVDSINSQVAQLTQQSNNTSALANNIRTSSQDVFNKIGDELTQAKARLDKLEAARVAIHTAGPAGARGPVVAGPGEYIVKKGDTGATIARANGVRLADLMAVNPDVNWNRMQVGQRIKLPARAGAQPAQQPQPAAQ